MNPERKLKSEITSIVNVVAVYMVSGVLIMYGGINISFNVMEIFAGFYKGQWWLALPFLLLFGLLPVIAGVVLLIRHPATATKKPPVAPNDGN